MKAAIFYNPKTNPENKTYAAQVARTLTRHAIGYAINPRTAQLRSVQLALAVGGDGTVLYVANLLAKSKIPLLGINFGHRGYLCQVRSAELEAAVARLKSRDYSLSERTRLATSIKKEDGTKLIQEALNEISIGGINRTVHIQADIAYPDHSLRADITGDGLIIATRTGSTAYNINAGGPMLLTDAFSVVANNAFFKSEALLPVTRSLVLPESAVIRIRDLSHNQDNLPFVIADGQDAVRLHKDDQVLIKKSKHKNLFISF